MSAAAIGPRPSRALTRRVLRLAWDGLAVTGLLCILYFLCFDLSEVVSSSMAPTLQGEGGPGSDWVLSDKVTYRLRRPRRWELVQFRGSDHQLIDKRVAGLPGEVVSLVNNQVAINGSVVARPKSMPVQRYIPYGRLARGQSAACGTGYFLLGDDTRDSQDSRFEGPVSPAQIRARPWLIVWPPSRIRFVNP